MSKSIKTNVHPEPHLMLPNAASKKIIFWIGISILVLVSFGPTLHNAIDVWDDEVHLSKNKDVRSLTIGGIQKIFTDTVNKTYIPLTTLSFAVEYHFFKYQPFVYHLINLLLHLIATGLVFLIGRRLGLSFAGSVLATILFGIHPMRVESVAWITERKDVLYATFYLAAIYAHCRYVESRSKGFFFGALACGLLSILAKAMALSLPLILLVCDWFLKRSFRREVWIEKILYLLYLVPIAWITYSLNARIPMRNVGESVLIWVWTLIFYLRKFLFPFALTPLYTLPKPVTLWGWNYGMPLAVLLVLAVILARWRHNRWLVFAFLYYFFSIFFLLRYDDIVDVNIVADRFMYLPSLGFCFLFGKWGETFLSSFSLSGGGSAALRSLQPEREPVVKVVFYSGMALLFLTLSLKTFQQCKIWKNDFSLWSYVLAKDPESFRAHFSLGQEFYQQGNRQEAWRHYQEAWRLNPTYSKTLNNIGEMLYSDGKKQEASTYFERAVFYKPDYVEARNNYGAMLIEQGKIAEAQEQLLEAIRLEPDSPFAYINLGDLYYGQGQLDVAQQHYEKALQVNPDDPLVLNRLGAVYLRRADFGKAVDYFKEALILNPHDASATHNLEVARGYLEKNRPLDFK